MFNTEAHPIDPGALHCCSRPYNLFPQKKSKMHKFVPVRDRKNEDPTNLKFFGDDVSKVKENDNIIEIKKLSNVMKSNNVNEESFVNAEKTNEEVNSNQNSANNNTSNITEVKVSAPPSKIEKVQEIDKQNIEVTSKMQDEFSGVIDETSYENETVCSENTCDKKSHFDPQFLLEKIRKNNLYPTNFTAKEDYELLSCQSQPFLQRISIIGEFY